MALDENFDLPADAAQDDEIELGEQDEQDEDLEADTLVIIDEDGVEYEFEVVDTTEVDGTEYKALVPLYSGPEDVLEDSGDLVIVRVSDDLDELGVPFLEATLEEGEYDKVAAVFKERLRDLFDFEEEDEDGPLTD